MQKHQLAKRLVAGVFAAALLCVAAGHFATTQAFAMSEKQTMAQQMTKIDTSKLVQATKSAYKHVTASKPYKAIADKSPNTSSSYSYGNIAKSTFVKSSNHEVSLQKRSGHQQ
jgi:hypothetical protein